MPEPTATAALLAPKPRYRRVVDRYECPICGKRLGQMWLGYGDTFQRISLYTDTQGRDLTRRVFHPCGCDDIIPNGHGKGA